MRGSQDAWVLFVAPAPCVSWDLPPNPSDSDTPFLNKDNNVGLYWREGEREKPCRVKFCKGALRVPGENHYCSEMSEYVCCYCLLRGGERLSPASAVIGGGLTVELWLTAR